MYIYTKLIFGKLLITHFPIADKKHFQRRRLFGFYPIENNAPKEIIEET